MWNFLDGVNKPPSKRARSEGGTSGATLAPSPTSEELETLNVEERAAKVAALKAKADKAAVARAAKSAKQKRRRALGLRWDWVRGFGSLASLLFHVRCSAPLRSLAASVYVTVVCRTRC